MEFTQEELDYNKIKKGLFSKKTLLELKEKYRNLDYMHQAIDEAIKEIENEHDR